MVNPTLDLIHELRGEIAQLAKDLAPSFAEMAHSPDQHQMTRAEMIDYVAGSWLRGLPRASPPQSPEEWRHGLLVKMGPEAFLALADEAAPIAFMEQAKLMAEVAPPPMDLMALLMGGAPMPPMPGMPPGGPPPMPIPMMGGPPGPPPGPPPGMGPPPGPPPGPPGMGPPPGGPTTPPMPQMAGMGIPNIR